MQIRDGDFTLLDYDMKTGRTVWARENGDGTTTYRTDYPVDATIEANLAARNAASTGWAGDYHRIASIPLGVLHNENLGLVEAMRQDDMKYVSRFLNDSDNRAWRTKSGNV